MKDILNSLSRDSAAGKIVSYITTKTYLITKGRNQMKIGKSKYGSTQKKYWKLKDGNASFRILPPLGELADEGRWSVFYSVHYGYKNAAGKARPFQSSQVKNRKGMIEAPDAALDRINMLKGKLEAAKKAGDIKTRDALLLLVGGTKSVYNLDSNHYVNAIDEQGNIGVLKLRHRAKIALDAEIKKLRDQGIDPLSIENGRFFNFFRTGSALDTSFQVTVKKQKMNVTVDGQVMEVERDLVHKLNDEIIGRLSNEAAELSKLFKKLSPEEVEAIVKASNLKDGIVPGIDEMLGYGKPNVSGQVEEGFDDSEESQEDTPDTAPTVTKTVPTPPLVASEAAPTKAAAPTTLKTAPVATPVSSPQTTAEQVSDMSEDDFLASLGLNGN